MGSQPHSLCFCLTRNALPALAAKFGQFFPGLLSLVSLPEPEKWVILCSGSPQLRNCSFCHKNPSSNSSSSHPQSLLNVCQSSLESGGVRNGSGGTQTTGKMLFPSLTSQFSPWLGPGVGVTSHSRGGLRPAQPLCHLPWGQARTFLMTEHPKDLWPYFIILILFFFPSDADQIYLPRCEWRGWWHIWCCITSKNGVWKEEKSCVSWKMKAEIEILAFSPSLAFQGT